MKKAYLHIGVEKTGTTTIQSFLARNRTELQQNGFLFPTAPGKTNHVGLTIFACQRAGNLGGVLRFAKLARGMDPQTYSRQMLVELKNEAQHSECKTLVLSNEHLSSRVRSAKAIGTLHDALLSIADEVDVIVYLRRQDEAVLSEYSTRVKVGRQEPFSLLPQHLKKYNYAELLDRWAGAFGKEHVSVRIFEKEAFKAGDLISDFLQTIEYPDTTSLSRPATKNVSLDAQCLEYLRRLNQHLPANGKGNSSKRRGNIAAVLTRISTGERPRMGTREAEEVLKQFETSNRDVAIRYLNRQDGQLFANSPEPSISGNLGRLDEQTTFKIAAELWRRRRPRQS